MKDNAPQAARAARMREALRANLRRRKAEASPPDGQGEADPAAGGLERRRDPLAPRIAPATRPAKQTGD